MKALILAHKQGVLGRSQIPMALLPAFDRPLLARVIEDLWDRGARSLLVTVDERVPMVERWLEIDQRFEFDLRCLPVAQNDSLPQILTRIPAFEPAVIVHGASFGLEAAAGGEGPQRLSAHSLEDYRREMLRRISHVDRHASLAGVAVGDCVVESAVDARLARAGSGSFYGRGVVLGRRSTVRDCVLLRGAALLGRCDLRGCVVMPGTMIRNRVARNAIIGFEAWAERLARAADRAARRFTADGRGSRWHRLRARFGGTARQAILARRLAERWVSADYEPALRQGVIDWALRNPQAASSHFLSFR